MYLGQLAHTSFGYPFRGGVSSTKGSGILAVQMKDVTPGRGVQWEKCSEVVLEGKRNAEWLQPGDILLTARGNFTYAALISCPEGGEMPAAVAAPHFYVIRCRSEAVLPEYLVWWLNHGPSQRYFEQQAEGTLTKSIRRSVVEQLQVVLPSLEKQRAVIALTRSVQREQDLLTQLHKNNVRLLNALASELLEDKEAVQ